jgi:putative transcriptional regulator
LYDPDVLALFFPLFLAIQPTPGNLLIATSKSHDPDLAKSVVLLIHSDPSGAIGLILNHPTKTETYFGGPIPIGVRVLIRASIRPEHADPLLPELWIATQIPSTPGVLRVYAGYVGWSADQLAHEISRGLWRILRATPAIVFDPSPATLWPRLLR